MKTTNLYHHENLACIFHGYKPPNMHSWGPGVRDIYTLHYIISGKGYLEINTTTYSLAAGESFIIFPEVEVYYYPDASDPWEYIWVDFKGNEALSLLSMTDFTGYAPCAPRFSINLEPLFRALENSSMIPFEIERSNAKLRLLLSYYMENYPRTNTTPTADYVRSAKEYMNNSYWKSELTVSDIADFVELERSYLFRVFKESTGMSVLNYLTSYRIQAACTLLKSTELSIKSIAYSVGYLDQLYFSKVFKKVTSYTPSDYRKSYSIVKE